MWHWLSPCLSLASIYVATHQTDSASKYVDIGIASAQQIGSNEHLADFYALRSQLSEQRGETAFVLRDLQTSLAYNDSLKNEESREHMQNVRVNYESKRRTTEVQRAEQEAFYDRMIRNLVIVGAVIIVVLLVAMYHAKRRTMKARHRAAEERELFYRNVTHQLRTPMTVVIGMVEQLAAHIPANDTVGHDNLAAAKRQSQNLLELIKQLITASKEGTLKDVEAPMLTQEGDKKVWVHKQSTANTKASTADDLAIEQKTSILVAEDNDDVAMLICSIFEDRGYDVQRAADGQEALEMLQHELPDLLVTDIAMPRMDGLELMRHVRDDDDMSHLPIIVVSARVEDHERLEGIGAGAEVYLAKPFIADELVLRAKKILEQRMLLKRKFSQGMTDNSTLNILPEKEKAFMTKVNEFIDSNISLTELSSSFVADALCVSQSTFNRRVKNLTGMSSAQYLRERRIAYARRLLEETRKSVGEIELACGFDTPGYFSRLFKSVTGMSPSEYRRQHQLE